MTIDYTMSHEQYLLIDRLSASGIKTLLRSPAHYQQAKAHPTPPTPQQALGTLAHKAILEPSEYNAKVRISPNVDRRTKVGKEAAAAFEASLPEGAIIVTEDQATLVSAMRDAVLENPYASALLADGKPEVSIFWDTDGIEAKARLDWLCGSHDVVLDLKTAKDASFEAFAKSCGSFQYHVQHPWYVEGAERVGLGRRQFIFLVVESEPPHGVALYQLDGEAVSAGEARILRALDIYRECKESGVWPGYEQSIQPLSLPRWAL